MSLSVEQKELRRKHLGASDAAAALGLSPYKSPVELAMEKRGELLEDDTIGDKLAVRMGNAMERPILDIALEDLGLTGMFNEMRVHQNRVMAANFDALGFKASSIPAPVVPVEAKYVENRDQWGPADAGIDGIPQQYSVQMVHQIAVLGCERGFLAAYFSGRSRELRIYECVPPANIVTALEKTLVDWWNRHVVGGERPDQAEPCSLEVLARRIRTPGKTVEIDAELVAHWCELAEASRRYEAEAKAAKARLIESLGDAEIGTIGGTSVITYAEQSRNGYSVEPTKFRVLRPTKALQALRPAAAAIGGAV